MCVCTGKAIQKAVLERGFGYCCGKILEAVSLVHRSSEAKQGDACLTKGETTGEWQDGCVRSFWTLPLGFFSVEVHVLLAPCLRRKGT